MSKWFCLLIVDGTVEVILGALVCTKGNIISFHSKSIELSMCKFGLVIGSIQVCLHHSRVASWNCVRNFERFAIRFGFRYV